MLPMSHTPGHPQGVPYATTGPATLAGMPANPARLRFPAATGADANPLKLHEFATGTRLATASGELRPWLGTIRRPPGCTGGSNGYLRRSHHRRLRHAGTVALAAEHFRQHRQ